MGKIKKVTNSMVAKENTLGKVNKISKAKPVARATLKEKIRKTLGMKNPKKLKPNQSKLTTLIEDNPSVKVTKQSKKLQCSVDENSAVKIKQKRASNTSLSKKQQALEKKYKIDGPAVQSAFKAVQKLLEEEFKQQKKLFDDEGVPIFLQICSVKVPKCPPRVARLHITNSLFANSSDICFIVGDVKNIEKNDFDQITNYYETLFKDNDVNNIKTILPFYQLKTDYGEYELKRSLVELYDVFLVDGRISGQVARFLGKIFYDKRKVPVPVKLHKGSLQRNVNVALKKTALHLHSKGDSFVTQICHSKMNEDEKIENFWDIVQALNKEFPGGWKNIKSLHLKGASTMAIPVYLNLTCKNEVDTPVIKAKRPKAFVPISDELSTRIDQEVTVYPTGVIRTKKLKKPSESDNIDNYSPQKKKVKTQKILQPTKKMVMKSFQERS